MECVPVSQSVTFVPSVSSKTEKFLCEFARHSRSQKLRCCSNPSPIFYFNHMEQSIYSINFGIKYLFLLDISIQYFQSINNDQWLLLHHHSPTLLYELFRPLALFFSERASIGDFYIPVLLPVHRGVLSVLTLNGRALVPIGEYSISPTLHVGRTHRGPLDPLC
jgi:hypothetical protein